MLIILILDMSGAKSCDIDSAICVVVTPLQSSYFAGEPFSATITFTNTRSPESPPQRLYSHTRAAHSISSAPLARPPTSPGTPRTPVLATSTRASKGNDNIVRKGLVGRHIPSDELGQLPQSVDQRKKKLQARSLSVSIAPRSPENQLPDENEPGSAHGPLNHCKCDVLISYAAYQNSPAPISPVARSPSLPLSSNHPHARKNSVLDGNLQLHEMSHSLPPSPYALSASTSSFSLILDPIAENSSLPYPPSPLSASPIAEPSFTSKLPRTTPLKPGRRPPQIGLGQPSSISMSNVLRTAFSSSFPQPNTELILYSYAQLTGTVTITPPSGIFPTHAQLNTLHNVRSSLSKRPAVGGGSMDITSSLHQQHTPHRRSSHSRSASLSSGLLSLLSPSSLVTSASTPPATPFLSPNLSANRDGEKDGLGILAQDEINPETPLPTFEVQPTMLAVDLCLLPGESRSCV